MRTTVGICLVLTCALMLRISSPRCDIRINGHKNGQVAP